MDRCNGLVSYSESGAEVVNLDPKCATHQESIISCCLKLHACSSTSAGLCMDLGGKSMLDWPVSYKSHLG